MKITPEQVQSRRRSFPTEYAGKPDVAIEADMHELHDVRIEVLQYELIRRAARAGVQAEITYR